MLLSETASVVVDARFQVPAADLLFADARAGSLADRCPRDSDAGVGSGFFGKVGAFQYHGATAAVKELKSGTLDADSIGGQAFPFVCPCHRSSFIVTVLFPTAGC